MLSWAQFWTLFTGAIVSLGVIVGAAVRMTRTLDRIEAKQDVAEAERKAILWRLDRLERHIAPAP